MALPRYTFTRPSDGQTFTWSPITMGQRWDAQAAYSSPTDAHLFGAALLAKRVIPGDGKGFDVTLFREWEEDDYAAFIAHVEEHEEARRKQVAEKKPGPLASG